MARIACLTMQRDEEILLRPWLVYHGYLFGFENLIVLDQGSASERVLAALDAFAKLGVRVEHCGDTPDAVAEKLEALRASGGYDVALPMPCGAFLALDGADGISCDRGKIAAALDGLATRGVSGRTAYSLRNLPGFANLFRYTEATEPVVLLTGNDETAGASAPSPLIHVRCDAKPYPLQRDVSSGLGEAAYYALPQAPPAFVRFPAFGRLLAALGLQEPLREGLEACRPRDLPEPALVVDLDETPFAGERYAAANPDLGSNLFRHFLTYGFLEGRFLDRAGEGEVMDRLARLRRRVLDGSAGYGGLANLAHRIKGYDDADAILAAGIAQHGMTATLGYEHALLAHYADDYAEATVRWRAFMSRHKPRGDQYASAIHSARCAGDTGAAKDWLAAGLRHFPKNGHLRIEEVEAALQAEDLREAVRMLDAIATEFRDVWIIKRIKDIRFRVQLAALEQPASTRIPDMDAPVDVEMTAAEFGRSLSFYGVADAGALAKLLKNFESLGQNCEFGLVQRRYGAEPLGLLRWTAIHYGQLMDALRNRLEGMDAPDELSLEPRRTEYVLCNKRYGTEMHTFQVPGADSGKLLKEMTRRSQFLKNKLLSDLEAAEKIFVRLEDQGRKPLPTAVQLHDSLCAYGPNRLLYVTVTDDDRLWGTVTHARDGLFIGYIRRFGAAVPGFDPPFDDWDAIIRHVARSSMLLSSLETVVH